MAGICASEEFLGIGATMLRFPDCASPDGGHTRGVMMSAEEALFQRYGQEYPKGTVLFNEGDPGKQVFVLQSGRVEISKKVGELQTTLAVLGPGEFFGEMAIISNKPRSATALVTENSKLLVIDPKTFEGMIRGNSEIALRKIKR